MNAPTEAVKLPGRDDAAASQPYGRLVVKYSLMAFYGLTSAIVGIPTIRVVSGAVWEAIWPLLVMVASLTAIAGVLRSKMTNRHALELVSTIALIAILAGYSVLIVIRAFYEGDYYRLPSAILPIVVMVAPYGRLLDIVGPFPGWRELRRRNR